MEVKGNELLEMVGLQLVQTVDGIAVEHIKKEFPQLGDDMYHVVVYGYDFTAEAVKDTYKGESYQDSMLERGLQFQHKEDADALAREITEALKPIIERQKNGGAL